MTSSFYNPYYVPVGGSTAFNYYEPIPCYAPAEPVLQTLPAPVYSEPTAPPAPLPDAITEKPVEQTNDPNVARAGTIFNSARDSFKAGNFDKALSTVDDAIRVLPRDAALHEFRALTLFAQEKYQDAAGVIYSVLAVGPGWDWPTVKSFYPSTQIYTQQLADLQRYVKENPKDPSGQFLLAYHCLVLDQKADAVRLLKRVVELNPQDKLAAELIKALETATSPAPDDRPRVNP